MLNVFMQSVVAPLDKLTTIPKRKVGPKKVYSIAAWYVIHIGLSRAVADLQGASFGWDLVGEKLKFENSNEIQKFKKIYIPKKFLIYHLCKTSCECQN